MSFCSNSACHGSAWDYAGFDAPKLRDVLLSQLPPLTTPAAETEGMPLTYNGAIGALLQARCVSCHGNNGIKGLDFSSYASTMKGGSSGPVILPGNPAESLIIQKQSAEKPHFAQLSPQEIDLLTNWILAGSPEK